jgi:hypothetical protein
MADNVFPEAVVSAAAFSFRTDDLGGSVQAPASKILLGGDGTDDGFVSSANPMPVSLATVPSHPVTNAGTFAVQATQTGTWTVTGTGGTFPVTDSGGSLTVDAPVGTPVFVRLSDGTSAITTLPVTATQSGTWNVANTGTFAVQAAQTGTWTVTGTGGTFPVTDSGGSLTVDAPVGTPVFVRLSDGTSAITTLPVAATQSGTWNVANTGTFAVQAAQTGTWTVTGTGGTFPVTDSGGSLTVDAPVGTPVFVRLSDGTSAITSLQTTGSTAHDAVDANNPIKIGTRAVSTPSTLTLVSAADRTDLFSGTDGILLVRNHTTLDDVVQERATNTDGASTAFTSGLAAPGAGVRLCITSVTICNSSATFCTVDLRDGSAGSVLWTLPVPATGGVVQRFDPPLKLTANTALAFDASAATTTITISANGFKTKL